jgi:hypothetical protein
MGQVVTKAEFLRWLTVGKQVRLTASLVRAPIEQVRTVHRVKGMNVQFMLGDGRISHLTLAPGERVEKIDNGYRIVWSDNGSVMAEYQEVAQ